jgi:hypothetical protein
MATFDQSSIDIDARNIIKEVEVLCKKSVDRYNDNALEAHLYFRARKQKTAETKEYCCDRQVQMECDSNNRWMVSSQVEIMDKTYATAIWKLLICIERSNFEKNQVINMMEKIAKCGTIKKQFDTLKDGYEKLAQHDWVMFE